MNVYERKNFAALDFLEQVALDYIVDTVRVCGRARRNHMATLSVFNWSTKLQDRSNQNFHF